MVYDRDTVLFASPSLAFVLTFVVSSTTPAPALAQPAPPTGLTFPREEAGVCPSACCASGRWVATAPVVAREARAADAPEVFAVARGESVEALAGVVVTSRPGRARALAAVDLAGVRIARGEELPVLREAGEGSYVLWARGRAVQSARDAGGRTFRLLARPQTAWWVQLRNAQGATGWSDQPDRFGGPGRCG